MVFLPPFTCVVLYVLCRKALVGRKRGVAIAALALAAAFSLSISYLAGMTCLAILLLTLTRADQWFPGISLERAFAVSLVLAYSSVLGDIAWKIHLDRKAIAVYTEDAGRIYEPELPYWQEVEAKFLNYLWKEDFGACIRPTGRNATYADAELEYARRYYASSRQSR